MTVKIDGVEPNIFPHVPALNAQLSATLTAAYAHETETNRRASIVGAAYNATTAQQARARRAVPLVRNENRS
jgi:hypothetical protein